MNTDGRNVSTIVHTLANDGRRQFAIELPLAPEQDAMVPALGYHPTTSPDAARVRAARWGVLGLFAVMGAMLSTFLSRMPSIRDLLDVTPSGLANLIIFGALGALAGLLVTGWAAAKFGTRALLWWSSFSYLVAFVAVAYSTEIGSSPMFAISQLIVSFSFAFTNVAMNAEGANVERKVGRSIMPQFHAAFSVGMAGGLGIGAWVSHMGVAPFWHFTAMALVLTVVRLAVIPMSVLDGMPPPNPNGASLGGPFATAKAEYREKRVVMIGLIVFAAAMTEMVAAQWIALSIVDDFGRPEAIGDLIYWVFVITMVTVRWYGAAIIDRVGRVVTLRAAAFSVVTGLLVFAFAPYFWMVPIAAALWGAGAALGVPIGFSAAADEPGRAAARVAAVASFSTIAGLVAPQAIGHLAEVVPLRQALLLVAVASLTSFILARAVRRDGKLFTSRRAQAREVGSGALHHRADAPVFAPGSSTATGAPDAPVRGK
jgi:MFS family permease